MDYPPLLGDLRPINFVLYISVLFTDYMSKKKKKKVIKNKIITDTFFFWLIH